MAEAAEAIRFYESAEAAVFADSLEHDVLTRRRFAKFMGSIVLKAEGSVEYADAESASLLQVAEDYYSENQEARGNARNRLKTDFTTNVFEILCASGHVSEVEAEHVYGSFYQYGYSLPAMYAHGALHAKDLSEQARRGAEGVNEFRIEDGYRAGFFQTHYFVEASRAPDDMDTETAEANGYDTKTWKCKLRLTDVSTDGKRVTSEASVAGVDSVSGERHDEEGIKAIREGLDLETVDLTATNALSRAFWVPKAKLPHGAASLAKLFDSGLEHPAFFGVRAAEGDYATITEQSRERERRAALLQDQWIESLASDIRQASSCEAALKVMARCAKDFAAEICGTDTAYNPGQFGQVAAAHIEAARYHANRGEQQAYQQALEAAKQTAIVYMCGMRLEMEKNEAGEMIEKDSNKPEKDCDYISKECPLCHAKNVRTYETKAKIECGECKGSVKKKQPAASSYQLAA